MRYAHIRKAIFLDRPNRFIAHVMLDGKTETVHVKNTGRCKELLVPNTTVYLEESDNPARKTKYDLIVVEKVVAEQNAAPAKNPSTQENNSPSTQSVSANRQTGSATSENNAPASQERLPQSDSTFRQPPLSQKDSSLQENLSHSQQPHPQHPLLINMDSLAPNKVAAEWILQNKTYFPNLTLLKPEYTLGDSRFDFYAEYKDQATRPHKMLIEVKGCTLEQNEVALFPDAPTLRGLKHVKELTALSQSGEYECMILIIVQMKGLKYFTPNRETHPDFANALKEAKDAGVKIVAVECDVAPDTLTAKGEIKVVV